MGFVIGGENGGVVYCGRGVLLVVNGKEKEVVVERVGNCCWSVFCGIGCLVGLVED